MNIEREKEILRSELGQLARLIEGCPPEDFITRLSFESRRAEVESELRELEALQERTAPSLVPPPGTAEREETDLHVACILEGLLPHSRRFELRRTDTGELVGGRLSRELQAPEVLKSFIFQRCVAHLRVITFQRPSKELRRYELRALTPPQATRGA